MTTTPNPPISLRGRFAPLWAARLAWCFTFVGSLVGVLPFALSAAAAAEVEGGATGRPAVVEPDQREQLYSVSVDVASRSLADRKAAAAAGLEVLLTRLSGLTALPESSALKTARAKPDRFYSQFRYVTTDRYDELGQFVTELRLKYSPPAVRRLMTSAELPLWTLNRPRVAIWLAERSAGGSDLIDDPAHPLLSAVLARATYRGLPAVVPGFAGVSVNAVWRRNTAVLLRASERFDAPLLLVGRAEQRGPDDWEVRWTTWSDGQGRNLNLAGSLDSVAAPALDMVADAQTRRFSVAGGAGSTLELIVENIRTVDDYAQILQYLGSLGYVEKADVNSMRADELTVIVTTTSGAEKFSQLLQVEGRLTPSTRIVRPRPLPPTPGGLSQAGAIDRDLSTPAIIPVPVVAQSQLRVAWQG